MRVWKSVPIPKIMKPTDVILKVTATTISKADLDIINGKVPSIQLGRILGGEAVGLIHDKGEKVAGFELGDKVVVSNKSPLHSNGTCLLGTEIDGTQAEYVRVPQADKSLVLAPEKISDDSLLTLSDLLPIGYPSTPLNGKIKAGSSVAIVGAGPVGLAALLNAQRQKAGEIIVIDLNDKRLEYAKTLGATALINPGKVWIKEAIFELTSKEHGSKRQSVGADVAIDCVGIPSTFEMCKDVASDGAFVTSLDVSESSVDLELQDLWKKNIVSRDEDEELYKHHLLQSLLKRKEKGEPLPDYYEMSDLEKAYDIAKQKGDTKGKILVYANDS